MKPCLLLINIQVDHFEGGKASLPNASSAVLQAAEVLQCYRDHHQPFMHIQSVERIDPSKPFFTGTSGIRFHDRVPHFENEPIAFTFEDKVLPIQAIATFMRRSDCSELAVCFFGSTRDWREYILAFEQNQINATLISDASAFHERPNEAFSSITLEKLFTLITSSDPQDRAKVSPTVLYNANNNVLPKDK